MRRASNAGNDINSKRKSSETEGPGILHLPEDIPCVETENEGSDDVIIGRPRGFSTQSVITVIENPSVIAVNDEEQPGIKKVTFSSEETDSEEKQETTLQKKNISCEKLNLVEEKKVCKVKDAKYKSMQYILRILVTLLIYRAADCFFSTL